MGSWVYRARLRSHLLAFWKAGSRFHRLRSVIYAQLLKKCGYDGDGSGNYLPALDNALKY